MFQLKVKGKLKFAGDKSLSHRAAILAAIARGKSRLSNYLPAHDTINTLQAMAAVGATVSKEGEDYVVDSPGISHWKKPAHSIDVGNSGTGARLLLGLFSGVAGFEATLDGDASLRKRPMRRVVEPLSAFGARFEPQDNLPITVHGQKLLPVIYQENLGSAQVKSALMLAALASGVSLRLEEPIPSRDHTENMFAFAGVYLSKESLGPKKGYVIEMEPPYQLEPRHYQIWGDISSAAFFVVLGLLANEGELVIENVLLNPFRDSYIQVLRAMGGNIEIREKESYCGEKGGDLVIYPSTLKGIDIDPAIIPSVIDELPILTIAGLFASGQFSFRGAKELRVKESDRISAMVNNLRACGAEVEEFEDGLSVKGNPGLVLRGPVESFMDHRIIMSFEIARLRSQANLGQAEKLLEISGSDWVETSFPDFYQKLQSVVK